MAQTITMTPKELSRYEVVKRLIATEINGAEAAKQMDISVRQVKRLKARVGREGVKGIIHGNRGKPSNRRISEAKCWLSNIQQPQTLDDHCPHLLRDVARKRPKPTKSWS